MAYRTSEKDRESKRRRQTIHRKIMKEKKIEVGKCARCHLICDQHNYMGFDWNHLDPRYKISGLSRMASYSLENILKEIEKTELLCKVCHAVITHWNRHQYKESGTHHFQSNQLRLEL